VSSGHEILQKIKKDLHEQKSAGAKAGNPDARPAQKQTAIKQKTPAL